MILRFENRMRFRAVVLIWLSTLVDDTSSSTAREALNAGSQLLNSGNVVDAVMSFQKAVMLQPDMAEVGITTVAPTLNRR